MTKKYYEAIKDIEFMGVKIVSVGDIVEIKKEGEYFVFVGHPLGRGGFSQNDLDMYFVEYQLESNTSTESFTEMKVEFIDTDGQLTATTIQGKIESIKFKECSVGTMNKEVPLLYSSLRQPQETCTNDGLDELDDEDYCDDCGEELGLGDSYWCQDCAEEQDDFY